MTQEIRAMVLAAGIGSRLQPLSDTIPKPLIKIGGRTVMEHILLLLKRHSISNIISNTHYLSEQIHDKFANIKAEQGIDLKFVYEEKLSGVAGGIRKCKDFLQESTACIIMGDAVTDIDLSHLYEEHRQAVEEHNCLVTIAQMQVADTRHFGVIVTESLLPDHPNSNRVIKFQEKPKPDEALSNWANTGIYFFEPEVYNYIPDESEAAVYDVAKDLFPKLLAADVYMQAIEVKPGSYWADVGTPEQYLQTVQDIAEGKVNLDTEAAIDPNATIDSGAELLGFNEIGASSKVGAGSKIENCIIWDNVTINDNCLLEKCIIGSNAVIPANSKLSDQIIISEISAKTQ